MHACMLVWVHHSAAAHQTGAIHLNRNVHGHFLLTVLDMQIKWLERRTNLESLTKGVEESEKEVFELDDTGRHRALGF